MPKSNYGGKSSSRWLLARLHESKPLKKILDVGPGVGIYTKMRQDGQTWIGVEAWAPYIKKYELEKIYDQVIVSDIRYFDWSTVGPLDVVICGDVLEHMTREEARRVVDKALHAARFVIVSMPIVHSEQGPIEDNPFEIHVEEDWTDAEALAAFPEWCVSILESYLGVYVLARDPEARSDLLAVGHALTGAIVIKNKAVAAAINIRING